MDNSKSVVRVCLLPFRLLLQQYNLLKEVKTLRNSNPEAQLLGNMEKLAGDLLYHHLRSCGTVVKKINNYGLIVNYNDNYSKANCLKMDFGIKSCTLEEESEIK